jgi:DNA mismatch endonuclease (patch repair protein)
MRAVKGRGNRTTEVKFRFLLVRGKVRGWKLAPADIPGRPDFFFPQEQVAVFVDGCFWHGCRVCGHVPSTNRPYWQLKLQRTQQRDARTNSELERAQIAVLRFWEHELKDDPNACLSRLTALLKSRAPRRRKS